MEARPKIRIKDIAELAGVSVGTVDRVLHGRKNISKDSLERVRKVLNELSYVPNHYASALATNRTYEIAAILPMHEVDSYWARVEKGLYEGVNRYSDFRINFRLFSYDPFNNDSFEQQFKLLLEGNPYAVIIGPLFSYAIVKKYIDQLVQREIPYGLLDSTWPEFSPLTYYGQDAEKSGAFAARIILMAAAGAKQIALFRLMGEGRVASRQQLSREVGFRQYMEQHSPKTEIVPLNLYVYDRQGVLQALEDFFDENPHIRYGLSFNSSINVVARYLKAHRPDMPHVTLLGYDAVDANVCCIRDGSVDFLIAQHPQKQGLNCMRSLINATILRMKQRQYHYVSIDLLTRENIDFYVD